MNSTRDFGVTVEVQPGAALPQQRLNSYAEIVFARLRQKQGLTLAGYQCLPDNNPVNEQAANAATALYRGGHPTGAALTGCAEATSVLSVLAHCNSGDHGFWPDGTDCNFPEKLALIHSEVSEMLEVYRKGDVFSEKIPAFTKMEEEAADVFIRLLDLCAGFGIRLGDATIEKMTYNLNRPHMHGKTC